MRPRPVTSGHVATYGSIATRPPAAVMFCQCIAVTVGTENTAVTTVPEDKLITAHSASGSGPR
jgi:hypothetical protein